MIETSLGLPYPGRRPRWSVWRTQLWSFKHDLLFWTLLLQTLLFSNSTNRTRSYRPHCSTSNKSSLYSPALSSQLDQPFSLIHFSYHFLLLFPLNALSLYWCMYRDYHVNTFVMWLPIVVLRVLFLTQVTLDLPDVERLPLVHRWSTFNFVVRLETSIFPQHSGFSWMPANQQKNRWPNFQELIRILQLHSGLPPCSSQTNKQHHCTLGQGVVHTLT